MDDKVGGHVVEPRDKDRKGPTRTSTPDSFISPHGRTILQYLVQSSSFLLAFCLFIVSFFPSHMFRVDTFTPHVEL
jgi:hypothetical protein